MIMEEHEPNKDVNKVCKTSGWYSVIHIIDLMVLDSITAKNYCNTACVV